MSNQNEFNYDDIPWGEPDHLRNFEHHDTRAVPRAPHLLRPLGIDAKTGAPLLPSEHQIRVDDFVANGRGSAIVIAVAGSGKSTAIEYVLPSIPERSSVTILAFNKTIADELNVRLDRMRKSMGRDYRRFQAKTFHSLGVGAVAYRLGMPVRSLTISDKKMYDLAEKVLGEDTDLYTMYASFCVKLVGFAKGIGIGPLAHDTDDTWYSLISHHDLTLDHEEATEDEAVGYARQMLDHSNKAAKGGFIDYDDMLYLPLLWNCKLWQNDWVIVDEAQDTSPVRRAMAKKALRPGGRSMWVGDPKQAIYGFTGASADAMELIRREFNAIELPLTVCYRCAQSVVVEAQEIVPYIEYAPASPVGLVDRDVDMKDVLARLDARDAILCRNTAPLVQTAFQLIAQGRGCVVLGRDIGAGLINLIKKMKARDIETLLYRIEEYRNREVTKFMGKGEETKAERVNDNCDCIVTLVDNLEETQRTIAALIKRIEGLFSDVSNVLTLATVHKAKGKEWKRVGILRPDLMPSKWARQQWQVEQEANLRYVAITRAKEELIWIAVPPKANGGPGQINGR